MLSSSPEQRSLVSHQAALLHVGARAMPDSPVAPGTGPPPVVGSAPDPVRGPGV